MPDTRTRITKRARSTEDAEGIKKMRVAVVRLPLYKDHYLLCELLGIPPRDKLASLNIRREVQDLCKQHGFELTQNYSTWGAKAMRNLVNQVTAQLNADPKRKKVIPTTAVDALVHKLCLDNVRNMRVAQDKRSKGDSDEEEDRNSKHEEDRHTSSDEDTPAAPTEQPYAQQQAVETDMDDADGQDDKEFRHFGGGIWSVNKSHTEIDEQLSNQVTDMPNVDLNGQTRLAEAHDHEMRLPPSVRAKCDDETRSVDNGREIRPCELNPAPKPLSPAATVPEDAVHISLPQTSQCDTRTSILVHFGNESPSNPPVVIPRARPWHMLFLSMTRRVPCKFNHVRLGAIVPETTEMVYLDTEQAWVRLTARREVVRLILLLVPHTEGISLPQASQCDTRTSILVHFGNESPLNPGARASYLRISLHKLAI
ncbi:hypothetical protein FN846DRAFT_892244 [Sphaerosporella brunnea]|uniref:Uncharacterized protein n=1 Tax=Sphaerosporella brunnea TaxID=1250544 RepID=A0A5J5EQI7_9PEZI|nr:hypothetical protein FN846DRAFT_892244 [Sphaerosporella brunnea]